MNIYLKRRLSLVVLLILFVTYYIATDPDNTLLQNLPFGASLLLTANIFVIAIVAILLIEFVPDFFVDYIYGKERTLRLTAEKTSQGAGLALVAKSIRILSYGIIVATAILSYNLK